jgi:hypothetical protein
LANIRTARSAYADGAKSGAGVEALNTAKGYVNTFLGGQMFDLKSQEFLGKSFADFSVDAAARMQKHGQITENERKLLAQPVARYGNSQAGNLLIMEFMEAVAQREIGKAKYFSDLVEEGKFGLGSQVDFYKKNPIEIKSLTGRSKAMEDATIIIRGRK